MMIPRSIRSLFPLVPVLALVAAGCGSGGDQAERQPPPVTVARPETRTVRDHVIYTGTTRAIHSAEVVARVAGRLETVDYEVSDWVEQGQVLFTIEREKYQALRDGAFAALASARADSARTETELERVRRASASRAVSEMDVDRAVANRDMAKAAVLAAEAQLAEAELNLSYCTVRAPIEGLVDRNLVDAGNLVGQSGPTPLTTINMLETIYVYFDAPEHMVLRLLRQHRERGQRGEAGRDDPDRGRRTVPAYVSLADEEGFPHEGVIDYIGNEVDPRTGTIEMRVVLDNSERFFFPGLFVRVKVEGPEMPDRIVVPETALGTDLGGKYVYVVGEDDLVEQRYVTLGQTQDDGTVHVEEGLARDEIVIVGGMMFARPGRPVTPLTAERFEAMQRRQAQGRNG